MAEIETRVAVIENNLEKMSGFFDRLDTTMEKLTEVSSSIKELLAVHELKINQNDDRTAQLLRQMEIRREQIQTTEKAMRVEIEHLDSKLTTAIARQNDDIILAKTASDRHQYMLMIASVLIAFILWKIKIVPFIAPYLN